MIDQLSRKMIGVESSDASQTAAHKMVEMQTKIAMRKRKTRRGKKKKEFGGIEKFPSSDFDKEVCPSECVFSSCHYCNDTDLNHTKRKRSRRSRQILRPRYSPKAPPNSTQFIMDSHMKYDRLYALFDSPEYQESIYTCNDQRLGEEDSPASDHVVDFGVDTLFRESEIVDYGTATTDTLAFMEQDFESAMKNAKVDELSSMTKEELLKKVLDMADRAEFLEKELEQSSSSDGSFDSNQEDVDSDSRQSERGYLSKLQQENGKLKLENEHLKAQLGLADSEMMQCSSI